VFEIWVALVCFTAFTVLLTLKVEVWTPQTSDILSQESAVSWWVVFSPLFISDALNAYFCVIVFIRMYLEGSYKAALIRALWSLFMLALLFIFKYLLCQKLSDPDGTKLDYSEVMSPIFILLQLVMIRACQLH
jgi:D-alanyl-lipoteichoic acid acyltransferase DltB (MBOAT superfamily)